MSCATLLLALLTSASVRLEPASLTFGPADAALEILTSADVTAVSIASANSAGSLSSAEKVEAGRFRTRFTFPAERSPRVALLSLETVSASGKARHWVALPLNARAALKIETKPSATVTVTIGAASFGPKVADARGKLVLEAVVPPGFSQALVTAVDRASNRTTTPLELPAPPFSRAAALLPGGTARAGETAELEVFAVANDGSALTDAAALVVTAESGACAAPVARGNGVFAVSYRPPQSISAGSDTVSASVKGTPATALTIALGPAAPGRIAISFGAPEYRAGTGGMVTVIATLTDEWGNPVAGDPPQLAVDLGTIVVEGKQGRLEVPDAFGGREVLTVRASAGQVEGEARLPLRPGPPVSATLEVPAKVGAGEKLEGSLKVIDAHGNAVRDASGLDVTGNGRAASLSPVNGGPIAVALQIAKEDPPGDLGLEVRAGGQPLGRSELSVLPYQRRWAVVAGAAATGNWNLSQARAIGARLSVGLRLANSAAELSAEGAFAHYPHLEGANTTDLRNDAVLDMNVWSIGLGARYSVPIGVRLVFSKVEAEGVSIQADQRWGFAARGGGGLLLHALAGRVFGLIEYGYAPAPAGGRVRGNLGGVGFALGYLASF